MAAINHGTRGGYYAHRREGSEPCGPCREAINGYVREYRERTGTERHRLRETARRKALAVLREKNREEYDRLVADFTAELEAEEVL